MAAPTPSIRHISDTARWSAYFRARETESRNPVFRDPFASRLAGERGREIARSLPFHERHAWSWVARTWAMDDVIRREMERGIRLVVNLAAGLDARPYRMDLPGGMRWVEADLPAIIEYKEELLHNEKPRCSLERFAIDLSDGDARRQLFASLGVAGVPALTISEGLLVYLSRDDVETLARELASFRFDSWVLDVMSPALLGMLRKQTQPQFGDGVTTLKFASANGPKFFEPLGWKVAEVHSMLKTAARLRRLPLWMRLFALFPEPDLDRVGSRPWSAVCLMKNQSRS